MENENLLLDLVASYGWKAEKSVAGVNCYLLSNKLRREVALVHPPQNSKYAITHMDGDVILKGKTNFLKAVETVISEYFYAKKIK